MLTTETLEQRCEICSKLTINTPKRRQWHRSGVFIVHFEHISHFCFSVSIVNFEHVIAIPIYDTSLSHEIPIYAGIPIYAMRIYRG